MTELEKLRRTMRRAADKRRLAESAVSAAVTQLREVNEQEAEATRLRARPGPERTRNAARARLGAARRARSDIGLDFGNFLPLLDPAAQISALPSDVPILLLPIRMETRFVAAGPTTKKPSLLVRIYPDDCLVDSFHPNLSKAERTSVQRFWAEHWAAGGVEAERRAAWAGLVRSHGAGRAAWAIRKVRPNSAATAPVKADPGDVILVALGPKPPAAEATAILEYWTTVLRTGFGTGPAAGAFDTLATKLGDARADEVHKALEPVNIRVKPPAAAAKVSLEYLSFDEDADEPFWSRAARAEMLPDRFVLLGAPRGGKLKRIAIGPFVPAPLSVSPDPDSVEDDWVDAAGKRRKFPEDIAWMFDFDQAVAKGMGFEIDLAEHGAAEGFDELIAIGLRLDPKPESGAADLAELLRRHRFGSGGFAIVPQGAPTNNSEAHSSARSNPDDPESSYDHVFGGKSAYVTANSAHGPPDGIALAEALGLPPKYFEGVIGAGAFDIAEAKAMNTALWPATMGHFLTDMMAPLVPDQIIARTRSFFTDHVSGRGALPAIRINRQPYGILPTTAFSRLHFPPERSGNFLGGLHAVLETMAADWRRLASQSKTVMSEGDAQQNLLDVLGLHPASVEHHVRFAQSWDQLYNQARLSGFGSLFATAMLQAAQRKGIGDLLRRLGHSGADRPTILERMFLADPPEEARTPVIDKAPLSEERRLAPVTLDDRNYIEWLAAKAVQSPDAIRTEADFAEGKTPTALLYLYLRAALLTAFADESDALRVAAGTLERESAAEMRRSHPFIHVRSDSAGPQSRFASMYARDVQATGGTDQLIGDFLADLLGSARDMPLGDVVTALETLKDLPTARLERLFCEHLDCCGYRLDAWRLGLVRQRMSQLRQAGNDRTAADGRSPGALYLGAYGYLENVRPNPSRRTAFTIPEELETQFGREPVETDSRNRGYILAPGTNHAITAAVLRAARDGAGDELEINLSSERVRQALFLQDGMRQGQSLGALLGYMFERGVHDAPGIGVAEGYLQELRAQFPLVANHLEETAEPVAGEAIETIAARNVVDGLRFIEHARKAGFAYPYSLPLTASASSVRAIFDANLKAISEAQDALADLSIAESVHQALMSNIDRASGTLAAFAEGQLPGETPDVIRSPRSGRTLTSRLALNLRSGVTPSASAPVRAMLDPALDDFAATQLPPTAKISVIAFAKEPGATTETPHPVTAADLGLCAIDIIRLIGGPTPDPVLDELILSHVRRVHSLSPLVALRIEYLAPAADFRFIEVAPQAAHWRTLLFSSRPLAPSDLTLPRDGEAQVAAPRIDPARVDHARTAVDTLRQAFDAEAGLLETLLDALPLSSDPPVASDALVAAIDGALVRGEALAIEAALLGCSGAEVEWMWSWKAAQWRSALIAAKDTATRWHANLAAGMAALAQFDTPPVGTTTEELFKLLQAAENAVSATLTLEPGSASNYRSAIEAKRLQFVQRLQDLDDLATPASFAMADLVAVLDKTPALNTFDRGTVPDSTGVRQAIVRVGQDWLAQCRRLSGALAGRVVAADAAVLGIAAADLPLAVGLLQTAGKALAGEDTPVIPEFLLGPDQAAELGLSLAAGKGSLIAHAATTSLDPLEDWLHGLARVRPKARALEQAMLIGEAVSGSGSLALRLAPAQLPHIISDHWLGAAPPAGHKVAQETLLYTAIFAAPFDGSIPVSGLLLDEWSEMIPAEEETVGLTYHYDAPNSEPPQAWLLAVSPQAKEAWRWDDLVDCVRETIDLAKSRAVDPTLLDEEAYAQLLPATVLTVTRWPVTISTMLNRLDLTVLADA